MTKNAFALIRKSKESYLCPYCSNNHYKKEISELKEPAKSLSSNNIKLSSLENQTSPTDSTLGADSASNQMCNQPTYKQLTVAGLVNLLDQHLICPYIFDTHPHKR